MRFFNSNLTANNSSSSLLRLARGALGLFAFSGLLATQVSAQPTANDFQRVVVAENLNLPMEFEISKDGRVFVVSKCGEFYGWNLDQDANTAVRSMVPNVRCPFEDGLLSIALDPNFTTNNHVFMQYMINGEKTVVARYTVNADFSLDLNSYTKIIDWYSKESSGHAGGSMMFDNDGNLVISTGDNNGATGYYSSGGQITSGNTNDLRGKILRITPLEQGGYSIPAGNLFADDGQHRPEIYAMGFRNPFRMNKDPQTGYIYVGDVGPDASADSAEGPRGLDELNEIRQAGNFGWPWIVGFNQPYAGFDPYNLSNNHQENTGATAIPDAESAIWTVLHRATMAGPVYRYDPNIDSDFRLPKYYDGHLIFWDFNSSNFFSFPVDDQIFPVLEQRIPIKTQGVQGAIDMEFDPRTQQFYMLQWGSGCCDKEPFNNGILYRFDYIGGRDVGTNYALGGNASATTEQGNNSAADAIDGDMNSRWESASEDPQTLTIQLSEPTVIETIVITWEAAYSSQYTIEASADGNNWEPIVVEDNGSGGVELHIIDSNNVYAYVRLIGRARGTQYGHSIYEFQVFGGEATPEPTPLPELAYLNMPRTLDPDFTDVPTLLSETGVFKNTANMEPIDNLVPFEPNAKLWSDRALKSRWLSLPQGQKIQWSENGKWIYPEGTVAVKHFELPLDENDPSKTKRLETRLIVMKQDGLIYGVTYKWRDDNSDAELLVDSLDEDITITGANGTWTQTWSYPSPGQCLECHNTNSSQIIGPSTRQLNKVMTYPGGATENQLVHMNNMGMFEPSFSNAMVDSFAKMVAIGDTSASLEDRVKSYLDVNCAHCHGTGNGGSQWDASYNTPLADMQIIDEKTTGIRDYSVDYGMENALVVSTQGGPDASILFIRDKSVDAADRMPPIGRALEHTEYIDVLEQWINSLNSSNPQPTPTSTPTPTPTLQPGVELVSQGKNVTTSTNESQNITALAVDGSASTLWISEFASAQWITVDLGASYNIDRIVLDWEAEHSSGYLIQGSNDNVTWQVLVNQANESGCMETHTGLSGEYRYIRLQRDQATQGFGYGLWEFQVYGTPGTGTPPVNTPTPSVDPTPTPTPTNSPTPTATPLPTIAIGSPSANQQFVTGSNVNLSVNISDANWFINGGRYQYRLNSGAAVAINNGSNVSLGQLAIGSYSLSVELLNAMSQTVGTASTVNFSVVSGTPSGPVPAPALIEITQPVLASSQVGGNTADKVVDADLGSRWESESNDPEWIRLDLGEEKFITRVTLLWEAAYSSNYEIQISSDDQNWQTVYATDKGNGGEDDITLDGQQARYVRMYGNARATNYGHSIFDFDVYGLDADPSYAQISAVSPTDGAEIPKTDDVILQVNVTDASWFANGGSYHYSLNNTNPVRVYNANAINLGKLATGRHTLAMSLLDSNGNEVSVPRELEFVIDCGNDCPNVLVFSKTGGFRHDSIEDGIAMIEEIAQDYNYGFTATEDSAVFTAENLANYSTIVFMNTTGDIFTDAQKAAFKAYIENGGGYVGSHAAADTEHGWDWYTNTLLAGAEFDHHGDGIPMARVAIENTNDVLVSHIGSEWYIADEWYFWKNQVRGTGNVEILGTLDRSSYNSNYPVEDHPVIFKNTVGQGRIFYTAMGHRKENFAEEHMIEMMRKAIEWTSAK